MDMSVILNPIVKLFLVMAIGFVSVKTGYLKSEWRTAISKIIIKITLPLMILTSLISKDLSGNVAQNVFLAAFSSVVVMTVLYALGLCTARLFHLQEPQKTIHAILSGSGNVGFMGYPIALAVFGAEGLFYAVIYGLMNDALFWTIGVYLIYKSGGKTAGKGAIKHLLNPNTIALLIGLFFTLFHIRIPSVVNETLTGIGGTTTYLSMLFIGMTLALVDIKKLYKRTSMLAPAVLKMVIAPVLAILLFSNFCVPLAVMGAVVLEIAMPAQTIITVVAMEAGSDESYAAEYIFFSTLFSLVTLPFVYYVMMQLAT